MDNNKEIINKAQIHHQRDEDEKAIELLETPALENDPNALYLLGFIYYRADKRVTGVSRNVPKARQCWLRALENGHASAANELANLYYFGEGLKENYKKAKEFWEIGFERNDVDSSYNLAQFYYDHENESIDKAIEIYRWLISNEESIGNCYLKLGRIYRRGLGVEKDLKVAAEWFKKGVEADNANSCMDLAMMYYKGDGIAQDYDEAIKLVEKAGEWDLIKDEAADIAEKMRNRTLLH